MDRKGFTESQVILLIIFIGLAILALVPITNKLITKYKEKKYEDNVNEVVEASKSWLSDKDLSEIVDGDTFYVSVNELFSAKLLSKEKISGCVKIVYQEKLKEYNYSYNVGTCQSIMTAKDILVRNIVTSGDGLYKEGKEYLYKGDNPNNYIMVNNVQYRILSLDSNGIKAIRNTSIESRAFDSASVRTSDKNSYCGDDTEGCNAYVADGTVVTQDSEIHQYLETVYAKIDSKDIVLNENGNWKIGLVSEDYKDEELDSLLSVNTITSNVGLININDYKKASTNKYYYYKDNWLNNNESFWTLTGVSDSNNLVWAIDENGKLKIRSASEIDGVRPVFNISSSINLTGSGTSDNPYVLNVK